MNEADQKCQGKEQLGHSNANRRKNCRSTHGPCLVLHERQSMALCAPMRMLHELRRAITASSGMQRSIPLTRETQPPFLRWLFSSSPTGCLVDVKHPAARVSTEPSSAKADRKRSVHGPCRQQYSHLGLIENRMIGTCHGGLKQSSYCRWVVAG